MNRHALQHGARHVEIVDQQGLDDHSISWWHKHTGLERLRDAVGQRDGFPGLWMLVAAVEKDGLPMLDGKAIPVLNAGHRVHILNAWLENKHRGRGGGDEKGVA